MHLSARFPWLVLCLVLPPETWRNECAALSCLSLYPSFAYSLVETSLCACQGKCWPGLHADCGVGGVPHLLLKHPFASFTARISNDVSDPSAWLSIPKVLFSLGGRCDPATEVCRYQTSFLLSLLYPLHFSFLSDSGRGFNLHPVGWATRPQPLPQGNVYHVQHTSRCWSHSHVLPTAVSTPV